jgi:hypothetical protein
MRLQQTKTTDIQHRIRTLTGRRGSLRAGRHGVLKQADRGAARRAKMVRYIGAGSGKCGLVPGGLVPLADDGGVIFRTPDRARPDRPVRGKDQGPLFRPAPPHRCPEPRPMPPPPFR